MLSQMYENAKLWLEVRKTRLQMRQTLTRLEAQRATIASRVLSDQVRAQESWGRQSTDYELGWNQALATQLKTDEKTALSLATITDTMIPQARRLFVNNPFAQSAIANLQHYVVGKDGFQYRKLGANSEKVNEYWVQWMDRVGWREIELEILKRLIRDGEVFLRWFGDVPRFVEPKQVIGTTDAPWGVLTDVKDQSVPKAYYVATVNAQGEIDPSKSEKVPAEDMQHEKWPLVDLNCLRGMPPFYFVAANLEGAARCLKNMRELVAVQTAIAIVREHIEGVSGTDIASWASGAADKSLNDPDTDKTIFQKKWASGLVVEVPHGEKLHFPASSMRADSYIEVVQADLRAVAASLGLPEFIFTADAGRSNYASLMAAEGPAVKAFEAMQGRLGRFLAKSFNRVILIGSTGKSQIMNKKKKDEEFEPVVLPKKVSQLPTSVIGPGVRTRDFFAEARTHLIEAQAGVLSPQGWCAAKARDYDEVMGQIEEHRKKYPDVPWPPTNPAQTAQYADDMAASAAAARPQADSTPKTGSERRDAGKSGA